METYLNSYFRRIALILQSLIAKIYYNKSFLKVGKKVRLISPLKIEGNKNIVLEDNVFISYKTWLACKPLTDNKSPLLTICSGCSIGNFNHIYATNSITIENDVLTADKVYITDNLHDYSEINIPIKNQKIKQLNAVVIGSGTWIGENACIIGVNIGKQCVIGANSVVTRDIPDYCVAVGAPARIIKRYNFDKREWKRTKPNGTFI